MMRTRRSGTMVAVVLLATACSGRGKQEPSGSSTSADGTTTEGGSEGTTSTADGGRMTDDDSADSDGGIAGAGASSTTGATSSGSTSTGAMAGDLGENECRTHADCPNYVPTTVRGRCASPFTPNGDVFVSTSQAWCGQLTCPAEWTHLQCQDDQDCDAARPHCGTTVVHVTATISECMECRNNADCSGATPVCAPVDLIGPSCVECAQDPDCPTGICGTDHQCHAACSSDDDCPDPATKCSTRERCEAAACQAEQDCGTNLSCRDGSCQRVPCDTDAECEGVCVHGKCHEEFGSCYQEFLL